MIHQNQALSESFSELVYAIFAKSRMGRVPIWDPFLRQRFHEVEHELSEAEHDEHEQGNYKDKYGRD